jgi:hypothetical protein
MDSWSPRQSTKPPLLLVYANGERPDPKPPETKEKKAALKHLEKTILKVVPRPFPKRRGA